MNNKMTLENFLNAGGLIEIRLIPEMRHFGEGQTYFAANSTESVKKMIRRLASMEAVIQHRLNKEDITIERFVENIMFVWNGIIYEPDNDWPGLIRGLCWMENIEVQEPGRYKPLYLIAKKKFFKG